jgi:hypothetical protein
MAIASVLPNDIFLKESPMEKDAKEALQVAKEIVVKFIESGRVSPTNFAETFPAVYQVVLETITRPAVSSGGRAAPGASRAEGSSGL